MALAWRFMWKSFFNVIIKIVFCHGAPMVRSWRSHGALHVKVFLYVRMEIFPHAARMALHHGAPLAIFFLNIRKEFFFPWRSHGPPYGRVSTTLEWKHYFPIALFYDMAHAWRLYGDPS